MSSKRPLSPLKLAAYLAAAVVVVSAFIPSASAVIGPIGVFGGLVAVFMLMFKRSAGRPPNDAARRLTGYKVRSGYTLLPDAVLLSLAVWTIVSAFGSEPDSTSAAVLGLVAGLAYAVATRAPRLVKEAAEVFIGLIALCVTLRELLWGDECGEALPRGTIAVAGLLLAAAFAVAFVIRLWKRLTFRKAELPSLVLAALGLTELIEFAVAPAGQDIITGLPRAVVLLVVGGVLLAACLIGLNPKAAAAMLGTGTAAGVAYLLLVRASLAGGLSGPGCVDIFPQLVMAATFTVSAVVLGSSEED